MSAPGRDRQGRIPPDPRSRSPRPAGSSPRRILAYARLLSLILAPVGVACSDALPVDDLRMGIEAPPLYRTLWAEVEGCSGLTGDFDAMDWYVTPTFPEDRAILGQWNDRGEITLRLDSRLIRVVVKHEILHELLGGDRQHASPAWRACDLPTGMR